MRKDTSPKKQRSVAQIEHDAEIAARARLTASLREQRLSYAKLEMRRIIDRTAQGLLAGRTLRPDLNGQLSVRDCQ